MGLFDYYPDIPKPRKPLKPDKRTMRLAPAHVEGHKKFAWLHQKTNYLMEMMKFFPDYENLGYAGRTEDDEDASTMWDQYGAIALESEAEDTPGHFGSVIRDTSDGVTPYGYGIGAKYEEVHFTPNAGDFNHIDAVKGVFENIELLDCEQSVLAGMNNELWSEVKALLSGEKRSYYEIAMDDNGELENYSNKEAFLLMTGMLESRTRVWLTMEELFGSFDEKDDQKRIAVIDSWVQAVENKLQPENIVLLSLFLDSQESFINRISAFYGAGTEAYISYEDKHRIPNFYENLKTKVAAYKNQLLGQGKTDEAQQVQALWDTWVAPVQAPDAYPRYQGFDWATTPGNILAVNAAAGDRQIVNQAIALDPQAFKGLREVKVQMQRPDGTVFEGNPYDHIWGTHIRGIFQRLIDKYINESLTANIIGRRKASGYKSKNEEYEQKIWDEKIWEMTMEKAKQKRQNERVEAENKLKAKVKNMDKEQKKLVLQALAKRKKEQKQEAVHTKQKIKIHGKQAAKKTASALVKGLKTSRQELKKLGMKSLQGRKKVFEKIFGQAEKRMAQASRRRVADSSKLQQTQTAKRRSVTKQRAEQTRASLFKKKKKE